MPKTIHDVEALGYSVGIAQGSVQVEEDALAEAKASGTPEVLAEQATTVTTETIAHLDRAGKLPDNETERRDLWAQIGEAAYQQLQTRANERVEFHERALAIAKEMPDVWVISGPGVTSVYVACNPDGTGVGDDEQAFLDALADPDAHKEREFQAHAPEEVVAQALEARALGADVVGEATENTWSLTIGGTDVSTETKLDTAVSALRDDAATSVDQPTG